MGYCENAGLVTVWWPRWQYNRGMGVARYVICPYLCLALWWVMAAMVPSLPDMYEFADAEDISVKSPYCTITTQ